MYPAQAASPNPTDWAMLGLGNVAQTAMVHRGCLEALSPFYCAEHQAKADHFVRFAACKQEASIEEAGRRLRGAFTQYLAAPP